jgi:hypothetical protein
VYPALCFKTLSAFDCIRAGHQSTSAETRVLRDDPGISCDSSTMYTVVTICAFTSLGSLCLGLPMLAWVLARRYRRINAHMSADVDRVWLEYQRVEMIVGSYQERFWYMESISLLHKLFFIGVIQLLWPGSRLQIWVGSVTSLLLLAACAMYSPYRLRLCQQLQVAALSQLALTYTAALFFFREDTAEHIEGTIPDEWWGFVLVSLNVLILVLAALFITQDVRRERRQPSLRLRVCRGDPRQEMSSRDRTVFVPRLPDGQYHFFVSCELGSRTQMNFVKEKLGELVPSARTFVDDPNECETWRVIDRSVKIAAPRPVHALTPAARF